MISTWKTRSTFGLLISTCKKSFLKSLNLSSNTMDEKNVLRTCKNILRNKHLVVVSQCYTPTYEPENHPVEKGNESSAPIIYMGSMLVFQGMHWLDPVESNSATPTSHRQILFFFSAHRSRPMFSKNPAPCGFFIDGVPFGFRKMGWGIKSPSHDMIPHIFHMKKGQDSVHNHQHPSHEFLLWRFVNLYGLKTSPVVGWRSPTYSAMSGKYGWMLARS